MKKIAEMTGLSIATVSHAINGTRRVSEKSLKLVTQAAEEIGYKPSLAAQILRTQKSGIIALIIPSSHPTNDTNSFYFGVLNGARAVLDDLNYDMIVSTYPKTSSHVDLSKLRVIQTRMVDGILLVPHSMEKKDLKGLPLSHLPVVLLDRTVEKAGLPTVKSDNFDITKKAMNLLIKSGKKRIGFLGGNVEISTVVERLEGYKESLNQAGIAYDENLVITGLSDTESQGYEGAQQLLSLGADGIFVENNMLMIGVVDYCKKNNIAIPNDLALTGFDNAPWMDVTDPTITAIQQNAEAIGEQGAALLLDLIEDEQKGKQPAKDVIVPSKIIKRNSI